VPIERDKKKGVSRISGAKADLYCIYFYYYFAPLSLYLLSLSVFIIILNISGNLLSKKNNNTPFKLKIISVTKPTKKQFKDICLPHTTNSCFCISVVFVFGVEYVNSVYRVSFFFLSLTRQWFKENETNQLIDWLILF